MKLATCLYQGDSYVAIIENGSAIIPALNKSHDQSAWRDMLTLIASELDLEAARAATGDSERVPLDDIILLAPIPKPAKNIMCLGLNYMAHAEETAGRVGKQAKKPQHPIVFTKAVTSVTSHEADIPFDPETCSQLDWEVELGVIVGRAGRKIPAESALDHVFGYTVINDISARDLQMQHKQYFLGKSIDGGCPMGPWIVTADEIPDPQQLSLSCRVNGETKQDGNTDMMIFSVADIIECLSLGMPLSPGDVIATGTPSGVGFARQPAEFLQPGDVVECEVQGVGVLRNRVGYAS